jgi:hypothetical protein
LIKEFFEDIKRDDTDKLSDLIKAFLKENNFLSELEKIQSQSKNEDHFKERFFEWFNGFKMLKLVHYLRDHYLQEKSLIDQSNMLLSKIDYNTADNLSAIQLLEIYRELDSKS